MRLLALLLIPLFSLIRFAFTAVSLSPSSSCCFQNLFLLESSSSLSMSSIIPSLSSPLTPDEVPRQLWTAASEALIPEVVNGASSSVSGAGDAVSSKEHSEDSTAAAVERSAMILSSVLEQVDAQASGDSRDELDSSLSLSLSLIDDEEKVRTAQQTQQQRHQTNNATHAASFVSFSNHAFFLRKKADTSSTKDATTPPTTSPETVTNTVLSRLLPYMSTPDNVTSTTQTTTGRNGLPLNNRITIRRRSANAGRHVLFYNIFIPDTKDGQENALRIVREQVKQIQKSFAAKVAQRQARRGGLAVYYVTVGVDHILTPSRMQNDFCGPNLPCRHVEHYQAASEVVTLQHVYNYCSAPEHGANVVTYLHNKGSFHFNRINENWRPMLTDAALSELCVQKGMAGSDCNVCGLQFYSMWTPFIPGNMFTAKCDYVKKLIPPLEFSSKMEQAIGKVVLLRLKDQLLTNLLPDRKDFFGLERYSDEHWIASHPDVIPCDCDPTGVMWKYHYQQMKLSDLSWAKAPRIHGTPAYSQQLQTKKVMGQTPLRVREYYFLAGNLVKWFSLYGKAPEPDAWPWTWFPDGNLWKQAVSKYGDQTVDKVTQKYASNLTLKEATFAKDGTLSNNFQRALPGVHNASPSSSQSAVVFFDMLLPLKEAGIIQEQLDIVATQTSISTVFYTTIGQSVTKDLCDRTKNLNCVHLQHLDQHHRGETPRQIYEYCRHNPTQRVIYLSNQLPGGQGNDSQRHARLIRHLTMAVTGNMCLNALRERDNCNLCGLLFFTIHKFHMSGNMWASDCSYINKLLEPKVFVERMRDFIAKVLIKKIWTRLNFGIAAESLQQIGLDGYAMEHWVGSHPSILPCDLTILPLSFWMAEGRNISSDFALRKGAHFRGGPFGTSRALEHKVRQSESLRMREFFFLAGNLLKWYTLYDEAPPSSSWIWSFFPDGAAWLNGVRNYGKKVVDTITSTYELSEIDIQQLWTDEGP